MKDKVIELGVHDPSVESVISRLSRFEKKIKHITVVVEWEDESSDVFHDTKAQSALCYDAILLTKYATDLIFNTKEDI